MPPVHRRLHINLDTTPLLERLSARVLSRNRYSPLHPRTILGLSLNLLLLGEALNPGMGGLFRKRVRYDQSFRFR